MSVSRLDRTSTVVALGGGAQERPPTLPKPKQIDASDCFTSQFVKRWTKLKADRDEVVISEWQDITQQIRPRRGRYFDQEVKNTSRRSKYLINTTPTQSSRTLGGGMMGGVSSPARPWFKMSTPSPVMNEAGQVKQWLYHVNRILETILAKSNFYDQIQVAYRDLGDFGNSVIVCDEDYDDVARFTVFPPGTYAWATDAKGRVNTVYYRTQYTVLGMVKEYGYENCSDAVQDLYDKQNVDEVRWVIIAIEPNMDQMGEYGPRSWPWISVHFEEGGGKDKNYRKQGKDDRVLRRTGYREWPAGTPRWDVQSGESWGSGPGLDALGDCRALQELEKEKGKAIKKLVTPPTQAPIPAGNLVSHLPGGTTYTPNTGAANSMIRPIYEQSAQGIQAVAAEIEKHERRINQAYYADLFLMLAQDTRRQPITAREVEERHEEKMLALGPVLERLHNECLNILLERVFWIAYRAGLIPPVPPELQGVGLQIEYTSILAQAQKATTVGGWDRFLSTMGNLAGLFPTIRDKIDSDQVADEYADVMGVPPSFVRDDDATAEARKATQQQMATAQAPDQASAAVDMAAAAKTASETRVGQGSALDQILGRASAST